MTAQAVIRGQGLRDQGLRDQGIEGEKAVITRFAPSPTGRLHLGHAYSAILAHDHAQARGGRFLLRIEDIDGTRSRPEHVAAILDDLAWLGLAWEGPAFQSDRLDPYAQALELLKGRGLVYPCFCTRADIAASQAAPHEPGAAYPGSCRALSPEARAARMHEPHCWRLDVGRALESLPCPLGDSRDGVLQWHDSVAGTRIADPAPQGDVILARKDAPASYHLAVTVDDAAQGITDVVRGVDLFEATHVHRLLQALLGLPTPRYHHHPLLTGPGGERLAKRTGAPALAAMRAAGDDGRALAAALRRRIADEAARA